MSYQDVTQDQVMAAVLLKLRTDLGLNEFTCYETEHPNLMPELTGTSTVIVTVTPGDGDFPIEEQGSPQLAENSDVHVSWYTKIQLDRQSKIKNMLHEAQRGILPWKKRILRSLLPRPADHADGPNELLLPSGNRFLRDQIFAKSYIRAGYDDQKMIAWATLIFGLNFDWDLTPV